MNTSFSMLKIREDFCDKLRERGFTDPSPIQTLAIPHALAGKDIIAQSQTGSGKTLAYLLPALQKIDPAEKQVQVVVLVPTRELGMQILIEAEKLTSGTGILTQSLIGGAALSRQVDKLKLKPHFVVGTPGRIVELIKMKKFSMHHVQTIIVDEVDQVFDLGSKSEVELIMKGAMRDRQIMFFSATITGEIDQVSAHWMTEAERITVTSEQKTADTIEHLAFVCEEREKIDTLRRILRSYNPRSAIVFINEIDPIAEVIAKLQYVGLKIEAIYGEASKQERANVMKAFREGRIQLLLATDVASRGLDFEGLTHVISLDPATDAEQYVHRVGRTGRMGRHGTAISIITPKERFILRKFEQALNIKILEKELFHGKAFNAKGERSADVARSATRKHADERAAMEKAETHVVRTQKTRVTAEPSRAEGRGSRPAAPGGQRKSTRERDKKDKGAPKWLKDKRSKE